MTTVTISVAGYDPAPYRASVGRGELARLPEILASLDPYDRIGIVYDARLRDVAEHVATTLRTDALVEVPSGEASKTLAMTETIASQLLSYRLSRQSVLIGIGGGVLTDLAGFVGSIYQRGIRTILVPSSLLCMVDAAVGGKTAVDLGTTKNALGTIHQPAAVVCDLALLDTLPQPAYCDGLVEVVKMAAILNHDDFVWLEQTMEDLIARRDDALTTCVARALVMKGDVIRDDVRDHGRRLLLNFGHTIGHAVEAASAFALSHGRAVAIGMAAEMRAGDFDGASRVSALLTQLGMSLDIPTDLDTDALWNLMLSDKKTQDGTVRMAIPSSIGCGSVQTLTKKQFLALRS